MSICPITDLNLERVLKKLRAELLMSIKKIGDSSKILYFQSALALQCFTNEYIYNYSDAEEKALSILEESVEKNLTNLNEFFNKKMGSNKNKLSNFNSIQYLVYHKPYFPT